MASKQHKKTGTVNLSAIKTAEAKQKFSFKLEIASLPWLNPYIPGIILFLASTIIGLLIYKDYGMSFDEPVQREIGEVSYNYIFKHDNFLKNYPFRGLGTGFELPLIFMEKWLRLTGARDIYLARHLATHLFFLAGAFCGYILAHRLFKNQFIACLAFIIIVLTPRMYAHSFFNTKDIPFLSLFIIAFLTCHIAFDKNKPIWYLVLGITCGYATSIRAIGIIFLPCIGIFFLVDIFRGLFLKERIFFVTMSLLLFITGFCGILYICWPILWSNPLFYFAESFHNLAKIVWNGEVLFNGRSYKGNMLPWNYTPVWFSITVPEFWLMSGMAGMAWVMWSFVKKPFTFIYNTSERQYLLYLMCFWAPILAMTALHGANIDDWRHLYFIYPSFILIGLYFINAMLKTKYKIIVKALCILQLILAGVFMVADHPFQQVYFNNFVSHAPEYLRKNFEMDYWGCSFKQGLDNILDADKSKTIKIYANDITYLGNNTQMLSQEDNSRIQMAPEDHADYFFTNYRNHPNDYLPYETIYSVNVLNSTVFSAFRLEKDPLKLKRMRERIIADLTASLALQPDNYFEQTEIGQQYFLLSDYDSAEVHFGYALRIDPTNLFALNNLAQLLSAEKKYAQSIKAYKKIIEINTIDENAYMQIGRAFFSNAQYDSSEVYNKLVLKINPKNTDAINNLAGVYFYRKQYVEAVNLYNKIIILNPGNANYYANAAACYLYLKKYDSAISCSEKAIYVNPVFNEAHQVLSAAYKELGNADSAKKYEAIPGK